MRFFLYAIARFPLFHWLRWLSIVLTYKYRFRGQKLYISWACVVKNCRFGYSNHISEQSILTNVDVGDFSYIGARSHLNNVTIGKFSSIAPNVKAGLGTHPSRGFISSHPAFYAPSYGLVEKQAFEEYHQTTIGNDVWIGANSTLVDGVTIGDGAIIGAHAVVTKDIPPYAVAVGVPAKIIRYRFSEAEIKRLQAQAWWDKPLSWIKAHAEQMQHASEYLRTVAAPERQESTPKA
ncbi:MAG: antibiotic acetyltransferase [Bacteroidetes bacterium]|nr:MAG: antibiotic acetyltransferase [Bacteroidota bacterium]